MASLPEILVAVGGLGVRDPRNPSARDFKLVLDAYLKDKALNTEAFTAYMKSLSVPLAAMFDGFKQFSADSSDVSKSAVAVIQQAMDVLQGELKREDISEDERREIRDHVLRLVVEARYEAKDNRSFLTELAYVAAGLAIIFGGVLMLVITGGKNSELIQKGIGIAGKAAANLVGSIAGRLIHVR